MPACTAYGERTAPVFLPQAQPDRVDIGEAKVVIQSKEANKAFGFDICGAGFPPSALLSTTAEQIYQRIQSHVKQGETAKRMGKPAVILGAADALVGMAIGIVTGESIGAIIAKGAQRSGCQYRCELWRNQTLQ